MMLSRRRARLSTDVNRIDRHYLHVLHHPHSHLLPHNRRSHSLPLLWPSAAAPTHPEEGGGEGSCSPGTDHGDDGGDSETELLLTESLGRKKRDEPSCGSRARGSHLSPHAFSPPSGLHYSQAPVDLSAGCNQSSSILKSKKPSPDAGDKRREPRKRSLDAGNDPHHLKRQYRDSPYPMRRITDTGTPIPAAMSVSCCPNGSNCAHDAAGQYQTRLPVVTEEREERGRRKHRHLRLQRIHQGSSARYGSTSDDGHMADGEDGSEYGNSDIESTIAEHLGQAARTSCGRFQYSDDDIRSKVEARIEQWKEARTLKLMDELKNKEAEIIEWERMQTAKVKLDMREFEMKLDKKREKALDKMTRSIQTAQKKAERKKLNARACAARKISGVAEALGRFGSTDKVPCRLICL